MSKRKNSHIPNISTRYKKLEGIPVFSLPAWLTCEPGLPCYAECYAYHMEKRRTNVRDADMDNYDIWLHNPEFLEEYIVGYCRAVRYFRWHGSGDIPDQDYLEMMVRVARRAPGCTFLAMTKRDKWINAWIDKNGEFPSNLKIMLSAWGTAFVPDNPHNLPVFDVEFDEQAMNVNIPKKAFPCTSLGGCAHCLKCWHTKPGEHVKNKKHH